MKREDRELLLKDLCARLPYDVFVKDTYNGHYGRMYRIGQGYVYYVSELNCNHLEEPLCYIKPYLRPMSSMTEDESKIYDSICRNWPEDWIKRLDFYLKYHFDYRGLIEKGLALEAPEGMYKN